MSVKTAEEPIAHGGVRGTDQDVTEVVYLVLWTDNTVPVLDHYFVHFFDGLEPLAPDQLAFVILEGEDVRVEEMGIGDKEFISQGLLPFEEFTGLPNRLHIPVVLTL